MRQLIITSFFYCLFGTLGKAQQHNFTNYSVTEGLAQSQVNAIVEDRHGFLWIGTSGGGLCRFDGKNFSIFTTQEGLSSNYINALLVAKDGIIWVSTNNGVNQIKDGQLIPFAGLPEGLEVHTFLQDTSEKIWFGTNKGLYVLEEKGINDFSHPYPIYALYQDEKKQIWVGGQKGLFKIEKESLEEIRQANGNSYRNIQSIITTNEGVFWIAAYNQGIFLSDGQKILRKITKSDGLVSTKIQTLAKDQLGNIWLGTADKGTVIWQSKSSAILHLNTTQGLPNNNVKSIVEDLSLIHI